MMPPPDHPDPLDHRPPDPAPDPAPVARTGSRGGRAVALGIVA
ncbi:hypothetical protein [Streptomyces sp. SID13031]|nr:hypothetical protein [Streptomyces sp. SID13031]